MNISLLKKIPDNEDLIILGKQDSPFDMYLQNNEEKGYLRHALGDKKKQIIINQYKRWIFLHIIEENKKPGHQVLEEIRKGGKKLLQAVNDKKIKQVCIVDLSADASYFYAFIEGIALSNYQFLKYLTKTSEEVNSLNTLHIYSNVLKKKQVEELIHLIHGVYLARDLVNEPLSYLTALQLSKEIEKIGKDAGFSVEVYHKKKIESLRMGGLLAVNKGSIDPPTFSILTWKPQNAKNKKPYVLVGKGIVYDTGGLSLKPTFESMDYMKCDMAGAAAVAGAIYILARTHTPLWVVGLIPATDNRPDGNAYAPGDIIRMYDGTTVEVLNTDAEGRMILADALSWAKKYNPELVIDIATLTGAAQAAIGNYGIVAMGNAGNEIFDIMKSSGEAVYERIAHFPFWDDYAELLKSDIADIKNVGGKYAGAITGGKFLEHFTDYPFIHLDIAGPAYNKIKDSYRGKGASGVGVRLLFNFLKRRA
ncbi:MAG: peptidase M17 [Bacteroides sp. SM23_62_1]|nr:MAG: peptidase M17 [Bacteroides sp. SM23_62_1]